MRNPLLGLAYRHLLHRPIRFALTVFGVGVGVAAVIAMHLANQAIFRSFEETLTDVVGKATIQITGTETFMDENLIPSIRAHPGVQTLTAILEIPVVVRTSLEGEMGFTVWAVDLLDFLVDNQFAKNMTDGPGDYLDLLLDPHTLFLGEGIAAHLNVAEDQSVPIHVGSREFSMAIRGIVKGGSASSAYASLGLMDIASAQSLFGMVGQVSRVEIVTGAGYDTDRVIQELRAQLGPSSLVRRSARRTGQTELMLRSFQLNLMTLSTVGLFVGVFLVYNAVGFSVVQYRREIGILRAIGTFRHQVATLFLGEAAVMGILGGVLGTLLGVSLAMILISLESQTVSELYANVEVRPLSVTPQVFFLGTGLGMVLALVGAIAPCVEAGRTLPARALAAGPYDQAGKARPYLMALGSLAVFLFAALLTLPDAVEGIPFFGYGSAFCVLLGTTLLAPLSLRVLQVLGPLFLTKIQGPVPQLAMDQLLRSPGRNSVTVSALVVGIAIVISVGVMVKSFRDTVEIWVDQTMIADFIVTPQSGLSEALEDHRSFRFSDDMIDAVVRIPGVAAVDPYRLLRVSMGEQEGVLVSRDLRIHNARSRYLFVQGDSKEILGRAVMEDGVIISEVLSERLNLREGETLTLSTGGKAHAFTIVGIFYDYATDGGKVVVDRRHYQRIWGDSSANVLAIYRDPSGSIQVVKKGVQSILGPQLSVSIISNQELRQEILEIFDRTFRMTYGLELIAVVVGVLGIINTLMTTVMERRREFATFRAIGAGIQQIRQMVLWESFLVGVLGVILGIAGGLLLGALLVLVINKQSFGWTIHFVLSGRTLLEAVMVGGIASFVAGYLPSRWVVSGPIAEGLRYE